MRTGTILLMVSSGLLFGWAVATPRASTDPLDAEFKAKVFPILQKHCAKCHSGKAPAGGLALDKAYDLKAVVADPARWERLAFNVKSKSMPPGGGGPSDAERSLIVDWVGRALATDCNLADSGKVTLRRLNRTQYQNTVKDLLGVDVDTKDFPSDDVGAGFDDIGEVLSLSPLYLEKLITAAESVATKAIQVPKPWKVQVELDRCKPTGGVTLDDSQANMFSNGDFKTEVTFDKAGPYVLKIEAFGTFAGDANPLMRVSLGGVVLDTVEVKAPVEKPVQYQIPFEIDHASIRQLSVAFINDYYEPQNPDLKRRDRNLIVRSVAFERHDSGPKLPNGPITALPKSATDLDTPRQVVSAFASRAWRRPVTTAESDRLMALYLESTKRGNTYEEAVQECVVAVLCSPKFLFLAEPQPTTAKVNEPLGAYEAASRLSYFLWGTMPDDALLKDAATGHLLDPKVLGDQVERMLQSSRARNLATDFASQWLTLRKLETASPAPMLFPEFNDDLRADMLMEVQSKFMDVLNNDQSILEFLDSKTTFVNERLAKVYGIPGVAGDHFRRVELQDKNRGGLVAMAGVLTVTSNPNRTSPVKRGKWILEQILGTPPPPPPPGAGSLPEDQAIKPTMTMKERLAVHRKKPECATCHTTMDAMGFSLENFDPVGRWREKDGDFPIDAEAELPTGVKVKGAAGLKKALLASKRDFVRCLAEKLLTYATGRSMRPQDSCHIDKIVATTEKQGFKFHALIQAVVHSDPFLKRTTLEN
ncbi:MAG: DUF1592 domain-containing protein [Armatimonadetes bacterium]|nr:DUF1592 domain-containing protein [Armatimonadota bacterium]